MYVVFAKFACRRFCKTRSQPRKVEERRKNTWIIWNLSESYTNFSRLALSKRGFMLHTFRLTNTQTIDVAFVHSSATPRRPRQKHFFVRRRCSAYMQDISCNRPTGIENVVCFLMLYLSADTANSQVIKCSIVQPRMVSTCTI